jgi:TRAP-type C4-dicarboxylate transport system substrate-binding protein
MMVCLRALVAIALLVAATPAAAADVPVLRIATVAPEGTSWARELRAWARDTEQIAGGKVRIKIYFGGIAGAEDVVLDRIRREQLDGAIGSELCTRLAPSMRVARVVGVFQTRDENSYVLSRLKPQLDAEFLKAGFINLGEAGLGSELLFTRVPVPDFEALKRLRMWVWDSDAVLPPQVKAMGLTVVQTPLEQAGRAFEAGKFDGFLTIPTAALAFQWTTQVRVVTALRMSFRSGCLIVATHAFDALAAETQRAMRSVVGKLNQRIEVIGRREDDALLGGLLAKQGVQSVEPSERLRSEFLDAALRVRSTTQIVPPEVLQQVLSWLADYRAEHGRVR